MTKFYSVGPDDLSNGSINEREKDLVFVVYSYEAGYYDGTGQAVSFDGEFLWLAYLGHCSCYGPCDGGLKDEKYTIEEFFTKSTSVHDTEVYPTIMDKVREVLREMGYKNVD